MAAQGGIIRKRRSKSYILDAKSGRELLPKSYGSLKGKLEIDPRIDLTRLILEQVSSLARDCRI